MEVLFKLIVVLMMIPVRPFISFLMLVYIPEKSSLESAFCPILFAAGPPDLQDSPGKDLCPWVELLLGFRDGGIEAVRIMIVIAGPEGVNDCCT